MSFAYTFRANYSTLSANVIIRLLLRRDTWEATCAARLAPRICSGKRPYPDVATVLIPLRWDRLY